MSFLNELKLSYEVSHPPVLSLEEISISLEGLSLSKIKELVVKGIKKVIEFFTKIFKWIREKLMKFLRGNRVKEILKQSLFISKFKEIKLIPSLEDNTFKNIKIDNEIYDKLYTDDEVRKLVIDFFKDKEHGYFVLFNYDNLTLIDFKNLINLINDYFSNSVDYILNIIEGTDITDDTWNKLKDYDDYSSQNNSNIDFIINNINSKNYDKNRALMESNPASVIDKLKREELFKWVNENKMDEYNRLSEDLYNNFEKNIRVYINKLEAVYRKGLDRDSETDAHITHNHKNKSLYDLYRRALNYLYSFLKIMSAPSQVLSYYIQLLDYICNKFSSKEYLIDPNPPKYKHLYHLSDNPKLVKPEKTSEIFIPLIPKTGIKQILPPRIPFSDTVIGCCYGTPKYFYSSINGPKSLKMTSDVKYDFDNDKERELYLYEGMQTSDTQFIKPAIVMSSVGEANYSKEICVLNGIEVKKIGKVKIHYDAGLPIWHPRKFAEVEIIEEY